MFMKKHNTRYIQSQIFLNKFERWLRARIFLVISGFINLKMDLRWSKTRKFNKQTHQSLCFQEFLYMCIQHTVILSYLCKWKCPKWLFFVVKRYTLREAKKWRYAVRNAKIERYTERKGGGGVSPSVLKYSSLLCCYRLHSYYQ